MWFYFTFYIMSEDKINRYYKAVKSQTNTNKTHKKYLNVLLLLSSQSRQQNFPSAVCLLKEIRSFIMIHSAASSDRNLSKEMSLSLWSWCVLYQCWGGRAPQQGCSSEWKKPVLPAAAVTAPFDSGLPHEPQREAKWRFIKPTVCLCL